MNALELTSEPPDRSTSRGLPRPAGWCEPARLYAIVLDRSGHPGPRHFLAELPEGAAVFALAAPGVRFLLHEQRRIVAGAAARRRAARRRRHRRLVRGAARRTGSAAWRCRCGAAGAGRQPRLCRRRLRDRASGRLAAIGSADPALSRRRRQPSHRLPRRSWSWPTRSAPRSRPTTMCWHIDTGPCWPAHRRPRWASLSAPIALPHRRRAHQARRQPAPALAADARDRRGAGRACAAKACATSRFPPTAPILVARPGQDPLAGVLGVLADAEGFELSDAAATTACTRRCSSG